MSRSLPTGAITEAPGKTPSPACSQPWMQLPAEMRFGWPLESTPHSANSAHRSRTATFSLKLGVGPVRRFCRKRDTRQQRGWRTHPTTLSGDLLGDDSGFSNNDENSYHVCVCGKYRLQHTPGWFHFLRAGNAIRSIHPTIPAAACITAPAAYIGKPDLLSKLRHSRRGLYSVSGYNLMVNCAWIGNRANLAAGCATTPAIDLDERSVSRELCWEPGRRHLQYQQQSTFRECHDCL